MVAETLPEAMLRWQKVKSGRQWDAVFTLRHRAEYLMDHFPDVHDIHEVEALRAAAAFLEAALVPEGGSHGS